MEYRKVGRTGLLVSRICVGTVAFGERLNESESHALIDLAIGKGVNFFDTANSYNEGRAEEILGRAISGRRYDTVLASKVGAGPIGLNIANLSRKHIMHEVEGSLRRLRTDYIDILYAHKPDTVTPIEETIETLGNLVLQGKVRYLGCSNFFAWQVAKSQWVADLRRLARFECIQPRYNLLEREIEAEVVPLCVYDEVSIFPYGALAGGILSGKYVTRSDPHKNAKINTGLNYRQMYWNERSFEFVDRLKRASDAAGHTPTQTSLAWLLEQPRLDAVIVGMHTPDHLESALSSLKISLSKDEHIVCAAGPLA